MLRKVKRIKMGPSICQRLMNRVLEQEDWRCQKRGSLENFQIHRKSKRSQQGNDALENLLTWCAYCHLAQFGQLSRPLKAMEGKKKRLKGSIATV